MGKPARNIFDQYEDRENKLTHALGIALARAPKFRRAFVKQFFPGSVRADAKTQVVSQLSVPLKGATGQKRAIPDLVLIDVRDHALLIEAKVTARLDLEQLRRHQSAVENRFGTSKIKGLVLLARHDEDPTPRKGKKTSLPDWRRARWTQVFELVTQQAGQEVFASEFGRYLELMEMRLLQEEIDAGVQLMHFAGIPFARGEAFTPGQGKRIVRQLTDELANDTNFCKSVGLPRNPKRHLAIKDSPTPWDFLSPAGPNEDFTKRPHFTLGVNATSAEAMVTVPNSSAAKYWNAISHSASRFEDGLLEVLRAARTRKLLNSGARPVIRLVQRRYKNMRLYAHDGRLEFDLRTLDPAYVTLKQPRMSLQPCWARACFEIIQKSKGNLQFQIGFEFPYDNCPAMQGRIAIDLFKKAFQSSYHFAGS